MLPPPDPGSEVRNVRTGGPARDRQQGDGAAEVRPPAEVRGHGRQHVIAIYKAVYTDVECQMVTLLLTAFQSWLRVSGWFQSRPYNISGGFRTFRDVSGCFQDRRLMTIIF